MHSHGRAIPTAGDILNALLRANLAAGMVRNLCSVHVEVRRFTFTDDGRGGQTETLRTIGTYTGRLVNASDSESIPGGGIQSMSVYALTVTIEADIQASDRVYIPGESRRYFDVVGTDTGQTDLLVQHVGLVERVA